ncbi:MAG: hypothetical protein HKP58_05950 [Desulfatitalea sp.]|nr:hypothetical protein [Desulfatitalea sp.]NNJ99938.1 hypothetical protein [Desulfatitalea sp.]
MRHTPRLVYVIPALLILICIGVVTVQFDYDPSQWRDQPGNATGPLKRHSPPTNGAGKEALSVKGLTAMSAAEIYDRATLSDKIDGKAELYLSAGFQTLHSRRFVLENAHNLWMERFVYDMGSNKNAFAVFSSQRRQQAQPLDLTPDAYQSANGVFFVLGKHYVEVIGSDVSQDLLTKMNELARVFVAAHPAAVKTAADERTLLPQAGLRPDAVRLIAANAFGFDRFERIFAAEYQRNGSSATAFVSRCVSAEQAQELARAYVAFLQEYDGRPVPPPDGASYLRIIEILDAYEIIFSHGPYLAGVHEAVDLQHGLALTGALYTNVSKANP